MKLSRRDLVLQGLGIAGCSGLGALEAIGCKLVEAKTMKERQTKTFFKLYPVGRVEKKRKQTELRIFENYADALKGLDGFSHVFVMYWFDKNDTPEKRSILQVYPRGNRKNPLTGVFACRAPVRPNLIAVSLCKISSVKEHVVRIDKIDAFDGSPILDLKPYIPGIDSPAEGVRLPKWLKG